ncbi:glycosyltransferase [Promicromonospora sukumoe]|uniref:glycosyltransferase n=1 Tax=Promicromonospora sukumoe TaxID=88382 RepID=UPI0003604D03|nr:glycosyltransferase [Promicromonospora sukumoe]
MTTPPLVSIVLPVHNDETWIGNAIESCLRQSVGQFELICVDDASTDGTSEVIERYQAQDERVRLIRLEQNGSAFQGRRAGIMAAQGEYLLFVDGDDEFAPDAVEKSYAKARATDADLVGFGVEVINPDGQKVGGYQKRLAPIHQSLSGDEVFNGLFPVGKAAQGQLWRYLFRTSLLREVYEMLPADLVLPRVNDLPIMFLTAARARKYVSIQDRLYRYFFRRGGSGHAVADVGRFAFYMGAIDSVESIRPALESLLGTRKDPDELLRSYESARLSMIANVIGFLQKNMSSDLHGACLDLLHSRVPQPDVVLAAVTHCPEVLATLATAGTRIEAGERPVKSVLLTTKTLTTGGVSGVLLSQAHFLLEAGYKVTVVAHRKDSVLDGLPEGAKFIEMKGKGLPARVEEWAQICRDEAIDVIIDQQILYSRQWPSYALMARALGVPTIGWIHNFGLRPIYDQNDLTSFLTDHLNALATTVTLSPLDVAYWKLRGIEHTVYLPNPPSPLLIESAAMNMTKTAPEGRIELVWWGRLDERTKKPGELLAMAQELRRLSVDFELTVIGPDWKDYTVADLAAEVERKSLGEHVKVVGARRGEELIRSIDAAHLFVTTSIIEGYQLTLAEAQVRGVPVVMYELPWLVPVQDNEGIVAVRQGDAVGLAREVAAFAEDRERYLRYSQASVKAAERMTSYDMSSLYQQLVQGTLPAEFSPEPTLDDARQILDWTVFYAETSFAEKAEKPRGRKARRTAAASKVSPSSRKVSLARRVARRSIRTFPALEPVFRRVQRAL